MDQLDLIEEARHENHIVAGWLLWYNERKQEYEQRREELLYSSKTLEMVAGAPVGFGGGYSDPTGAKASKLAELRKTEQWLRLVEEVELRLPPKMQIFLRLRREYRYSKGRNGWVAPVQWKFAHEMAKIQGKKPEDTWIESRRTFWVWWDRIVEYTARIAAKRGLLK